MTPPARFCTRCRALLDAGLVNHPGGSLQELLYVPPEIEPAVSAELTRLGLVSAAEEALG